MKKQIIAFALSLILTLSTMASATATEVQDERYIPSVVAIGSQLYLLDIDGRLTTRTIASSEETLLANVGLVSGIFDENRVRVDVLFEQEGKLFGFDFRMGTLFELVNAEGEYAPMKQDVVLDISAMYVDRGEFFTLMHPSSVFARDGWLYYTVADSNTDHQVNRGRISLTTGENTAFRTEAIKELAPYQEGKLLALIYDDSELFTDFLPFDYKDNLASIGIFDPETDTLGPTISLETDETIEGIYITSICYEDDRLYYRDSARVMCMDLATGEKHVSAYTGDSSYSSFNEKACSINGHYIVYGYEGIKVLKLDSEFLSDGALMVYGEYGTNMHKTFAKNYPEIPVDIGSNTTLDLETLAQTMVSESQTLDLLLLNLTYAPVDELAEKGYCLDLSGYPEITSRIESMYPQYRDVLLVDGKLCGVPVTLYSNTFGVYMPVWESLGLAADDLPTSIMELLEFVENWTDDYGDEFPDVKLFDFYPLEAVLFTNILEQYMLYKEHNGEPMRFDTPEFKRLMNAYEQINFDELSILEQKKASALYYQPQYLFTHRCSTGEFSALGTDEGMKAMPLPLFGEDDPLILADLNVMIINPKTTRLEQALTYMTNYLDNLDDDSADITLYPDHNEPVENEDYASTMQYYTAELENARTRLEAASPETMADAKANVKSWEADLAAAAQKRYRVSTEDIAWYRETIHPLLVLQRENLLYSGYNMMTTEIGQLKDKYMDGAITSDQLAKEFDKRLLMMELED